MFLRTIHLSLSFFLNPSAYLVTPLEQGGEHELLLVLLFKTFFLFEKQS